MSSSIYSSLWRVLRRPMASDQLQPFTVFVEGNIGSGKTTLLKHFEALNNVYIIPEPVIQWQNVRGHNLLDLFYKDPQKNGMTFQSCVQLTMLKSHLLCVDKPLKMLERSLFSARYCFVENLSDQGVIGKSDAVVLDDWFKWLTSNLDVSGNLIVYLRTTPEIAYERIKKRARSEESSISLEYLRSLHELHEDWLIHGKKYKPHVPVIVVDGTKSLCMMKSEYKKCEGRIMEDAGIRMPVALSL